MEKRHLGTCYDSRIDWHKIISLEKCSNIFFLLSARDSFKEMLDSVAANGHEFDDCKKILREGEYESFPPYGRTVLIHKPIKQSSWTRDLENSMLGAKPTISLSSSSQG